MKESTLAYIPRDRLEAISSGEHLPNRANGSILFADISGFTPLTEAYEKHLGARKGGEELARILNEVYGELIGEVDKWKGSVIGFAGDAITCWFFGDDGLKAINCALSMQDKMKGFSSIPSPSGESIAIGLKAAVTTGAIKRFIVGDEAVQQVDVVVGEPVYKVAEIEGMAKMGEVLIDAHTRQRLDDQVVIREIRSNKNQSLTACIIEKASHLDSSESWPPLERSTIEMNLVDSWLLPAVRQRLQSGLSEFITELRPATAMFLKFDGIDFEMDPDAGKKLHDFFSRVQNVIEEFDGIVHQLTIGDKGSFLYSAFGAPISHEDDTNRTFAAALALRKLSESLDYINSIRIGIGRGTTRAGAYGGPTRRTYGVLGDQVNLAARLMGKAEPGQILASEEAVAEAGRSFRLEKLPAMRVKGKTHPIEPFALLEMLQHTTPASVEYSLPMIGRSEELQMMLSVINDGADGRGQIISIEADAGLGKTRLIHECLNSLAGSSFRILAGECQAFGANTAYTPWWTVWREFFELPREASNSSIETQLLQRLERIENGLSQRMPLLGPVLNIPLRDNELTATFDAKLKQASLEGLLIECIRKQSSEQPVIIMLDDVHAMDAVSTRLLRTFIQAIARLPVVIIVSGRPRDENPVLSDREASLDYFHNIHLNELSEPECVNLITAKFKHHLDEVINIPVSTVKRVIDRTGGNPFFIDEVINWVLHKGIDITSKEALDRIELPGSLHSLVLSRMDQLEETPRVTMKVASVIGRTFKAAILWGIYPQLGGEESVIEALDILSKSDFTEITEAQPELLYLFKHVVIHEVAYESLPSRLREQLHEAIGNFIEESIAVESMQTLDLLAFHFGRSTNTKKKKLYYVKAADCAKSAYANEAAKRYYELALPLLEGVTRVEVLQNLGKVLETLGEWKGAMRTYKLALDEAAECDAVLISAYCRHDIGDLLRKTGSYDEASQWYEEAKKNFQDLRDEAGVSQVLHSAGTLAAQSGDYGKAIELYTFSMEIRKRLGDELKVASLLSNLGIIFRYQGKLEKALKLQQDSLEIRKRLNDPYHIGNSYNNLGMAKRFMGDLSGARSDLEESLRVLKKVGNRNDISYSLNSLAEVALDQKDTDSCQTYLLESLQLAREIGNLVCLAFIFETFAFNASLQGDPQRCLRLFGAAEQLREEIGAPLPKSDRERIDKQIQEITANNPALPVEKEIEWGATLSVSEVIDYALSVDS